MKTSYIYLNTYSNGYLYIGSHTWTGPPGILDPSYHGSSHIASHFHWMPSKIEVLEQCLDERKFVAEKEWIITYASKYGVAPLVFNFTKNKFVQQYSNPRGLLINCHSNSAEQICTKESRRKNYLTHVESGAQEYAVRQAIKASHSKESCNKRTEAQRASGVLDRKLQNLNIKAHTKESLAKVVSKRKELNSYVSGKQKELETRRILNIKPVHRKVQVFDSANNLLFTGSVKKCCRLAGNINWSSQVSKKFSQGKLQVIHHGFLFKLISDTKYMNSNKNLE